MSTENRGISIKNVRSGDIASVVASAAAALQEGQMAVFSLSAEESWSYETVTERKEGVAAYSAEELRDWMKRYQ